MKRVAIIPLCLAVLIAVGAEGQSKKHVLSNGTVVEFGPLTITGSTVEATVTYDAARSVYRYAYTIHAPSAPIESVHIDVSGRIGRPQRDASLQENITRIRTSGWGAGVTPGSHLRFSFSGARLRGHTFLFVGRTSFVGGVTASLFAPPAGNLPNIEAVRPLP
ncbi:MAG TPA: hypothetical protein VE974_18560 [Thermoanaerobaculia bacterium]|nr:hypothetical protein [Thermoanaerobaculia bacterium]